MVRSASLSSPSDDYDAQWRANESSVRESHQGYWFGRLQGSIRQTTISNNNKEDQSTKILWTRPTASPSWVSVSRKWLSDDEGFDEPQPERLRQSSSFEPIASTSRCNYSAPLPGPSTLREAPSTVTRNFAAGNSNSNSYRYYKVIIENMISKCSKTKVK